MTKIGKNKTIVYLIHNSKSVRRIYRIFSPLKAKRLDLYDSYLKDYILNFYSKESIEGKKFFNIGAGNQRSDYDFWSYIDLGSDNYNNTGIDISFDLESLKPLPIQDNYAEVVFNSFVIEHISVEATKIYAKKHIGY